MGRTAGQAVRGSVPDVLELSAVDAVCVQGTTATTQAAAVARQAGLACVVAALGGRTGEEEGWLAGEEGGTAGAGGAVGTLEA